MLQYSNRIQIHLLSFMTIAHFLHHVQLYTFPALILLIKIDISLSYLEIGFLGSLPTLIMALTSPVIGYLGKKERSGFLIIIIGIFFFSMSNFIFFLASDLLTLILGNILLGLGCTTFHPIGLGYSANTFGEENRGKAMAINHAAGVIGTATAPFLTLGLAVYILGWQKTYFLLGLFNFFFIFVMIAWILLKQMIKEYHDIQLKNYNQPIEKKSFIYQINRNKIKFKKWIIITLGIVIGIHALRSGVYRLISYFTITLLRDFYHVESFMAGILTSGILLLGSGTDLYGAYQSDKSGPFGRIKIILMSGFGTAFAILLLIFLTGSFPVIWAILFGFSLFTISFYLAGGTLQALMSDLVPQHERTVFYSIVFSLGLGISSISPTIFGGLLDMFHSPIYGFFFILLLIFGSITLGFALLKRMRKIISLSNSNKVLQKYIEKKK